MNVRGLAVLVANLLNISTAGAQMPPPVIVPAGFTVNAHYVGAEVTGIAAGSGSWSHELYFCTQSGGVAWFDFASGQGGQVSGAIAVASGVAIDTGALGTGLLYVSDDTGSVSGVNGAGGVSLLSTGGSLFSSNDLVVTPPGGSFPAAIVVTNGPFGTGTISLVSGSGTNATLVPSTAFLNAPIAVAFAPAGSPFGTDLLATVYANELFRVTRLGAATVIASGLGDACGLAVTGPGPFGDAAYVADGVGQKIWRVASNGTKTLFASGLSVNLSGWGADLAFSEVQQTLYAASGFWVLAITGACGSGQANGPFARMEINGYGSGACPGPQTVFVPSSGLLSLALAGPALAPFVVVGGPLNPGGASAGCLGLLHVGTPPALSDLTILLNGLDPPGPGNPWHLDASGVFSLSAQLPALPTGVLAAVQAAMLQPTGLPCSFVLTEALQIVVQ